MIQNKYSQQCLAAILFFMAGIANAAILTFTSESSFLNAMLSPGKESFESFVTSPPAPSNTLTMTDFTMQAFPAPGNPLPSNTPALHPQLGFDPVLNIYPTDGTAYVRYDSDANESVRFTFNTPRRGYGVNIVDWGDYGVGSLILGDDAGNSFTIAMTPQSDGNHLFFGIVNTTSSFSYVEILSQPQINSFGIDEVYYGTSVVPLPPAAMLFGAGLLGLVSLMKRGHYK